MGQSHGYRNRRLEMGSRSTGPLFRDPGGKHPGIILSRKALRGASFRDIEQLRKAIEDFVAAYGPAAKPFVWRKREVQGSQLRNTIVNLRN